MTDSSQMDIHVPIFPPGPKSVAIWNRRKLSIGDANYTGLYGVSLKKGTDAYIQDEDDNVYLDCLSCASSCVLGYGRDFLARSYYDQAMQLQQSCFTYSLNLQAIELAEKLIELAPGDFEKRVLIGLSGSDSSGGAIKAARKYTGLDGIIHFKNDYHGSTGLSQQASDYGNLDDGIYDTDKDFIEYNFPTTSAEAALVLEGIRIDLVSRKAGAIICEAIQGDAGVVVPPDGFIKGLRRITSETKSVLIIDEVQSGMGRTGMWWSFQHDDIVPDIFVVAKGLSSGYAPISAVVGRKDIIDSLAPGQHLFTYGGHPPSAAVALNVLQYIEKEKIPENCARVGNYLIENLKQIQVSYPDVILDVRGKGLMIGVQISLSSGINSGKVFATRCMELGVYVGFFGVKGDVVRIEPPLIITNEQADMILNNITQVAQEFKAGTIPKQTYENVDTYSIGI